MLQLLNSIKKYGQQLTLIVTLNLKPKEKIVNIKKSNIEKDLKTNK